MSIELGDVFIGNFPVTQEFGANPDYYKQFGLNGHEGIDFGCPTGTPIISATDGVVIRDFDDPVQGKNYGDYVAIWDKNQLCATYYAHLASNVVSIGQAIVKGQLIGYSNNTGNTSGPHLHFGLVKTDSNGNRLDTNNGFQGFINPDDGRIAVWNLKNPTEPVIPPAVTTPPVMSNDESNTMKDITGAFTALPDTDPRKQGNLQGYVDSLIGQDKDYKVNASKASQFDGFVQKWLKEWNLQSTGSIVDVENEMSKLLPLEDQIIQFRDSMESVVGQFSTDQALLDAMKAEKTDKQNLLDQIKKLGGTKVLTSFIFWKYLIKIYAQ